MFIFCFKSILKGNSPIRALLDYRLTKEEVSGLVLDLGSGSWDRYGSLIPHEEGAKFILLDKKRGENVDFEKDTLPSPDNAYDTILLFNVLEHIFNYSHLLSEVKRIKKDDGRLIGFVPFLMWYHPDHGDYFRYTHEALEKILNKIGYEDVVIEIIHLGPFTAAMHMIYTTIPKWFRPIPFSFAYVLDWLFAKLRPGKSSRYALGYYFTAR